MSVAVGGRLKPWKVMDPRACMTEADKYLFKQGGSYVSYRTITASSSSDSSVQWQCNPPSTSQIVSRLVFVTIKFRITATARKNHDDNAANSVGLDLTPFLSGTADKNFICPRQFPVASVTETCKVSINGTNIDNDPKKWIHALARYNLSGDERDTILSSSPSQPDYYQLLDDISVAAGSGDLRSPFLSFGNNTGEVSRGSFLIEPYSFVTTAAGAAAVGTTVFDLTVTEPLFISPFTSSSYLEKALGQVSEMNIQLNWDTNLSRVLSVDERGINGADGTANRTNVFLGLNVSVAASTENKITFTYITPQSVRPVPPVCTYDYHNFQTKNKNLGVFDADTVYARAAANNAAGLYKKTSGGNNEKEIISDNYTLNTIPSKMYVFVRQKEGDRTYSSCDTFARIKKFSLNFNGQDSLMNGAQEWDLWRMSVDNGLKMSYPDWQYYGGSVLCIDFGKNLGLGVNQCVGMLGNFDFQIKLTAQNIAKAPIDMDLNIVFDMAGILTLSVSQALTQMGIVTPDDVLGAEDFKEMSSEYLERVYGGSFLTGLKNVYTKAQMLKPYAKKAVKFGQMIAPVVETMAPRVGPLYNKSLDLASELLGNGYSKKQIAEMRAMGWTDAHFKKLLKGGGNMVAGNAVGGKCIPKSKLKQRISNY